MKKIIYTIAMLLLVTLGFQSCDDQEDIDTPDFNISFNQTAKVGEPVTFTVNNTPTFLNFFSGEFSKEFKNSNRVTAEGDFFLSFNTARHFFGGINYSTMPWRLKVSTDYTGSGTVEDVQAATWTNISDRFVFATARTYTPTNSGTVNITDLASDLPTFFAIQVQSEGKASEGNSQGNFQVDRFDIVLDVKDENYSLAVAEFDRPGFVPVNVAGVHPTKSTAKDYWRNRGTFYRAENNEAEYSNDDWLITRPINLSGAVPPDRGTPLKTYAEKLETFEYTYTEAGTYKIAFIGSNETIYGKKEVIKEYTITVTN